MRRGRGSVIFAVNPVTLLTLTFDLSFIFHDCSRIPSVMFRKVGTPFFCKPPPPKTQTLNNIQMAPGGGEGVKENFLNCYSVIQKKYNLLLLRVVTDKSKLLHTDAIIIIIL